MNICNKMVNRSQQVPRCDPNPKTALTSAAATTRAKGFIMMADVELHETEFPSGDLVKTGDIAAMLSPDTVASSSSPSHPQAPQSPSDKHPLTISRQNAHAFTSMAARDSPTSALSFPSDSGEYDGDSSSSSSNGRNEDRSGLQTPLLLNSHPSSSSGSTLCTQEQEEAVNRDTSYSDSCFEGIDNDAVEESEQASKHVAFHASTQVRYFVRSSSEIEGIKEFQANERRRRRKQKRERIRQILEDEDDDASCEEIEIEHREPVPPASIFQQVYGDILDLFRQDDEGLDLDNEQPWFPIHCIQPQCNAEHAG